MPKGEEVRSVSQQTVVPSALGLEVEEISSHSGPGRSVSLDIPLYRTDGMRRPVSGRDAVRSQVINALEAQEIKETGNEKE